MSLLDRIAADVRRPDMLRGVVATVTAVGTTTVDLSVLGGSVEGVPCARAYAVPTVGDVVLVVKVASAWVVLTSLGTYNTAGVPTIVGTAGGIPAGGSGQVLTPDPAAPTGFSWVDRGFRRQFWQLTAAGVQAKTLDYTVLANSEHVYLNGVELFEGSQWSRTDYTLSLLSGADCRVDDWLEIRYASAEPRPLLLNIPFQASGWRASPLGSAGLLTSFVDPGFDDSSWADATCPIGWGPFVDIDGHAVATAMPHINTGQLGHEADFVVRRWIAPGTGILVTTDESTSCGIYANGAFIGGSNTGSAVKASQPMPDQAAPWLLAVAIAVTNGASSGGVDIEVTGTPA